MEGGLASVTLLLGIFSIYALFVNNDWARPVWSFEFRQAREAWEARYDALRVFAIDTRIITLNQELDRLQRRLDTHQTAFTIDPSNSTIRELILDTQTSIKRIEAQIGKLTLEQSLTPGGKPKEGAGR